MLVSRYSVFLEKNGPILPPLVGLMAGREGGREGGRQAGRRNTGGFQNFKTSLQVKLFGILFCLILLFLRCVLKCEKFGSHFFHVNPYY